MKKILFAISLIILNGCHESDGSFSVTNSLILMGVIILLFFVGANQSKELNIKKEAETKNKDSFEIQFYATLKEKNIIAANCVLRSPEFGLAIADDKNKIAVYTSSRILHIIPKEKIYSCELNINNKTIVTTKSKTPVVSWNTLENTKGQ